MVCNCLSGYFFVAQTSSLRLFFLKKEANEKEIALRNRPDIFCRIFTREAYQCLPCEQARRSARSSTYTSGTTTMVTTSTGSSIKS